MDFERCRQTEDENFANFYFKVQQCSIDADLCKDHCNEWEKLSREAMMANKLMAGLKDSEVQTKILKLGEERISLENIVIICRTEENL